MKQYNKRWIEIIYLLLKRNAFVSGDEIALKIGVTSRTVRTDIRNLNNILQKHGASIDSSAGSGYILRVESPQGLDAFLEDAKAIEALSSSKNIVPVSADDRVWYLASRLLIASLDQDERIDSFTLADELFISDSTLKKSLRAVEGIFNEYGLKISETKAEGLHVIGGEADIRNCISRIVFRSKGAPEDDRMEFCADVFSRADVESTKSIVASAIVQYDLHLTDIAFQNLVVHALIMLHRNKGAHRVDYSEADAASLEETVEYGCATEIVRNMKVGHDEETMHSEVCYLCRHLIASQRFLIDDLADDYRYKEVIAEALGQIDMSFQIDLSGDLQLINGLALHLSALLHRMRFEMGIQNDFLGTMKSEYPLAFEFAAIAAEVIESEFNIMPSEAEIGFLAMHFGAALERNGLGWRSAQKPKDTKTRVALVCIAGVAMALLLKERLLARFGDQIDIVRTMPAQLVTQELIDDVDVVLTTADLSGFRSKKIVRINLFPEEDDLDYLEGIVSREGSSEPVPFEDVFRSDLFFTHARLEDKAAVLDFMTQSMIDKGCMDEALRASVYKREQASTTEMGSLLAIPHAMLNDVEYFAVSILILDKPILWDKQKVQVVLLLNVPRSKYDIWVEMFQALYTVLIANGGIARLIKHQDYERFLTEISRSSRGLLPHRGKA